MKTINNILSVAVASMLGLTVASCTDGNDWDVDSSFSRLFGLNNDKISVEAEDVQATVTFNTVPEAEYYIIEVSTDSLYDDIQMGGGNAIVFGSDGDINGSPAVITGLNGDTRYYLRMKAMSSQKSESKWSYYKDGATFKTLAEQIFLDPVASDRAEDKLHVAWTPGADVTNLVVRDGNGDEVQNIVLDDAAKNAGEYTITGLTPSTNYTVVIMNGETKRGTLTLSTTAAMPDGDYKVELSADITRITGDVINSIVDAAKTATGKDNVAVTIGLRPDMTYDVASYADDGSGEDSNLALPDGVSVTFFGLSGGEVPVMNWKKSLDIAGGHSYIRFENVVMIDGGCQYFVNQATDASVGELSFKECTFTDFERSLVRTQGSGVINVDNIIVDDCVLTNMSSGNGYSVFYFATTNVGKMELSNSTFDTSQRSFIEASKAPITNGVYITNCTFYNNVASGRYFMDANGQATNLTMTNTILGKSGTDTSRGVRTTGTMIFDNCLRTSDCIYSANDIKDLPAGEKSSAEVFKDPDNHDFTLKINQLIGDPRWYPAE